MLHYSEKARGRVANGAASPLAPLASPRRRGRPRLDEVDHFTAFYTRAQQANYNVAVQIFQYLGMRDLAHSARVCKLWQQLASTPALWRHVRMKNSHVSDWCGLCAALKRHGTKWLDLRKMLLPQNDTVFWDQFAEHIGTVDTLERLELCRCPARAVEAAMARVPSLRALAAPAIRDARLDPAPLAALPRLELLRLKSLAGLALASDLRPLAALTRLQHLSLTSIKVEILPLPTLQRLLSAQMPNTKLKLLRIPFHATWRQSLADFQ
ncbi:PREDICTED: uncharacterized protein LOC106102812 [Papilio polytes]|uniref:uncharacterized protein LOC106102812 n=1 Tax=Papilio polytes TaxID=76194 RepID=UPI000675CC92|nr:PREDICTED: uncharacterized protein LOC106102812 [Papilio polytes]